MLLSGNQIRLRNIIQPHEYRTVIAYGEKQFTYGEGPCGYDVRVEFDTDGSRQRRVLHPGDFTLASTVEQFTMPIDICGFVKDKSSWARRGLSVFNTVIEPGWQGFLTLELVNLGKGILTIPRGAPIAQVVFEQVLGSVNPYNGKYQYQPRGPQDAI